MKAARLSDGLSYELPMTQEQLADATGLTSVHVNRTLMSSGADGLITRTKREVVIGDWDRLAAAGDFDATYLHLHDPLVAATDASAQRRDGRSGA